MITPPSKEIMLPTRQMRKERRQPRPQGFQRVARVARHAGDGRLGVRAVAEAAPVEVRAKAKRPAFRELPRQADEKPVGARAVAGPAVQKKDARAGVAAGRVQRGADAAELAERGGRGFGLKRGPRGGT